MLTPVDLARAASLPGQGADLGRPLFVQLSDSHIGFHKDANPDVAGTLAASISLVNALLAQPTLVLHTGDITHRSKPEEFDHAQSLFSHLRATELHAVPGEHDVADPTVSEYFHRFGAPSGGKGYYSFDHAGVHFVALVNVLQAKDGGSGFLGEEQITWVRHDLRARREHAHCGVRAHAAVEHPRCLGLAHARC